MYWYKTLYQVSSLLREITASQLVAVSTGSDSKSIKQKTRPDTKSCTNTLRLFLAGRIEFNSGL